MGVFNLYQNKEKIDNNVMVEMRSELVSIPFWLTLFDFSDKFNSVPAHCSTCQSPCFLKLKKNDIIKYNFGEKKNQLANIWRRKLTRGFPMYVSGSLRSREFFPPIHVVGKVF